MVFKGHNEVLYKGLVTTMTSHLKEISNFIEATPEDFFLEELNKKWKFHRNALRKIRNVVLCMDRTEVISTQIPRVKNVGLKLWKDNVIHSNQIQSRLSNSLLELIHRERIGEAINRDLVRNTIKMLMDLGPSVYDTLFECPFLKASTEFYRGESLKFIECYDCGDYLKKAEKHLNEEMGRVSHYLDVISQRRIASVVVEEMIANHSSRLIHMENYGLVNMILNDKYEDIGRMYDLFGRIPKGRAYMEEVMIFQVLDIVDKLARDLERLKDPVKFFQPLFSHKVKYDRIVNLAFENNWKFRIRMDCLFEFYINQNPQSPKYLSLFLDDKFRNSLMGESKEDVEIFLDMVVMFIRYLHKKDVFQKYYGQHLAERLLCKKIISDDDVELSLIVKLKKKGMYQCASRFETMFTDIKTSQDVLRGFYASHPNLGDGPALTVQVLATTYWPIQPPITSCNLPDEVLALCDKYQSYYIGTYTQRKLLWKTNLGTAEIITTFGKGQKHELHVSTHQMCVLMLFNNADRLSFKEIQQATQIPTPYLKGCLHSMTLVEGQNVMKKEPISKDIGEDDAFYTNDEFTNKIYEVKLGPIVAIPQTESEIERLEAPQRVEENRKPQIDAAIMRIMKSRKQLDHENMITEVTKLLLSHFLADTKEIKKRIESLIERDFLERDQNDHSLYRYIS
ncbi:Winged helix-like DNA-binding domain superfamily [Sesbania bispinosa]|nr:Winged helix-like DNA-binding domain superfamily [Sesbania bispinosa]